MTIAIAEAHHMFSIITPWARTGEVINYLMSYLSTINELIEELIGKRIVA